MTDHDTIQYEATIDDSKVFTKPWTINIALHRRKDRDRLFEYACQAEAEETNGAFERETKTWWLGDGSAPPAMTPVAPRAATPATTAANIRRTADDKPDLQGFYESNA